jgi:predicted Zn-ribbon and HTH transcriptional regulator
MELTMGDAAELVLEGVLCETCGVYLESAPPGHPRKCKECKKAKRGADAKR